MHSILIVDDNPAEQFLYKQLFQTSFKNINVIKAMNGQQALETLENCSVLPNAILLDLNMPIMNGEEFLKEYEQKFPRNQTQIYLMADENASIKYEDALGHNYIKMRIKKPLGKSALKILSENLNLESAWNDWIWLQWSNSDADR